jgi:hypothetical protein
MTLLCDLGLHQTSGPVWRIRVLAMTVIASFDGCSDDPRWAVLALILRTAGAIGFFAKRQLSGWALRVLCRAWHGARFAAEPTAADTMVAAGGR